MPGENNPRTSTEAAAPATARVPISADHSWLEVSAAALRHNFRAIQSHVGPQVSVCPVIKSDAYGHGGTGCALVLRDAGVRWLAVSSVEEGIALRRVGIQGRILLLSGFWRGEEEEIVRQELTPAVWEAGHVELLQRVTARIKPRQERGIAVHLKVNTGMNRLGADAKDLPAIYQA